MAKRIKTSDLLRKINNISMEASDIEDEESDQEDIETVYSGNNDEFDEFEVPRLLALYVATKENCQKFVK